MTHTSSSIPHEMETGEKLQTFQSLWSSGLGELPTTNASDEIVDPLSMGKGAIESDGKKKKKMVERKEVRFSHNLALDLIHNKKS